MSEWKPIETAPRTGIIFDVWLGNAELSDLQFYCTPGTRRSAGWYWNRGKFRPYVGLPGLTTFVVPTHWMPISDGPEQ